MPNPSDHATADRPPTHGNGHVPAETELEARPARPAGPPVRPAAIVVGIIFVLFVAGAVGAGLSGGHPGRAAPRPSATLVPGTGGLTAVAARPMLAPVITSAGPPADVVGALALPRGTVAVPGTAVQRGLGLYDASLRLQVPASEQALITFLDAELAAGRWRVVHAGADGSGGYQFLAQHPGGDGYEWELGLTLSPSTFNSAVPGATVPAGGVTPMSLRLFAMSDQS